MIRLKTAKYDTWVNIPDVSFIKCHSKGAVLSFKSGDRLEIDLEQYAMLISQLNINPVV